MSLYRSSCPWWWCFFFFFFSLFIIQTNTSSTSPILCLRAHLLFFLSFLFSCCLLGVLDCCYYSKSNSKSKNTNFPLIAKGHPLSRGKSYLKLKWTGRIPRSKSSNNLACIPPLKPSLLSSKMYNLGLRNSD